MINIQNFIEILRENGLDFITGVPDTLLNDFCIQIEKEWLKDKHIIAANEGNAVALAAGYHLATDSIPLVYMQNSGIGNTVNPLVSLTHPDVFAIPMVLLIGWRGEPGKKDHPQHRKQGQLTPVLMDDMDIPYRMMSEDENEVKEGVKWAFSLAREKGGAVALLVPKGVLEKGEKDSFLPQPTLMSREEAIRCIVESLPLDTIFVASTGRATRELYEVRRLIGYGADHDFLNVGAMGHTSSIAAGIALGTTQRNVVCLDGDAALVMHMGSMGVIAQMEGCENLIHIVLNNGVHESVGGQESVGNKLDFLSVAKDVGYSTPDKIFSNKLEVREYLKNLNTLENKRPTFIEVKIGKGMRTDMPVLSFDLIAQKEALKDTLTN